MLSSGPSGKISNAFVGTVKAALAPPMLALGVAEKARANGNASTKAPATPRADGFRKAS